MESQYLSIETFKENYKTIMESIEHILEKIDKLDSKLYKDNGNLSIQTKMTHHDILIKELLEEVKCLKNLKESFLSKFLTLFIQIMAITAGLYALFCYLHKTSQF